ncbi:G protein coupled glucose receptor regulating Gpa2 protein [Ceratobasidium sp. AG-Ba]|nr:G protein coupled glucose receptor regulating Gpa2 protein [Ceratobasidium sp. AG-Ba]QRW10648.1 G protein coupled glucose receptor regulating Gpa2 protein [Ceratobasidium sp. AG-Ba]
MATENYCDPVPLSTGQVVGLSFATQAGFISAVAVIILLSMVAHKYWQNLRDPPGPPWRLIRTNIDAFMLNLLMADLLMSLGAILDLKWANERRTYCGSYCNAQGAIQILGETSVALFTLAITLYTFVCVVRGRNIQYSPLLWGYATHPKSGDGSFYAPTPYWCWISQQYSKERIAGEYIWLWLAGFGNILLYIPLFFILRGNVVWDQDQGWRSLRWRRLSSSLPGRSAEGLVGPEDTESVLSHKREGGNPGQFLWYPLAYTVLVLPMSIVRWITFHDKGVPKPSVSTATAVAVSIFNLSGLINVVLILTTRANVLLFGTRGVIPVSGIPTEQNRPAEMLEDDTNQGASVVQNSRRWFRASRQGLREEARSSSQDTDEEDTGFGGPRVRLGRDDDEEKPSTGASGGRLINAYIPQNASAPLPMSSITPGGQIYSRALPNIGMRQTSEQYAPGRAYLESLAGHRAENPR